MTHKRIVRRLFSYAIWLVSGPLVASNTSQNEITLREIDKIVELGKKPGLIATESIEQLFHISLTPNRCSKDEWACGWVSTDSTQDAIITHVYLPNPKSSHYRAGGTLVLEVPKTSCIPLTEISRRVHAEPMPLRTPPTLLSFKTENEVQKNMAVSSFKNMPNMDTSVQLNSWTENDCVVRLELNALLTN